MIADVAALPSEIDGRAVRYELYRGRLVILPPATAEHGAVVPAITLEIMRHGEHRGLGKVRCGGVGVILGRDPDTLVGADVLFVANDQLPIRTSDEDYLETIPALIAEVRERTDRPAEVADKVAKYLAAGVRLVWVLDPQTQAVTAHRPGQPPQVFSAGETLTADDVIPGFAAAVADLFRG
jgi:Uma2 family endonuclease